MKWHLRLLGKSKLRNRADEKLKNALFGEAQKGAPESRFAWMTKNETMAEAAEQDPANQEDLTLNVYNELLRAVDWTHWKTFSGTSMLAASQAGTAVKKAAAAIRPRQVFLNLFMRFPPVSCCIVTPSV